MNNIFHVIKDPVHGTMQFTSAEDAWIKPFIDSPNFQRLRHIKQLGMADFIFPGAVHSRFNHCLGCCYVASQIAHKIGLADEDRHLVMIACLLHDIGHGPFSHTFEDIFHNKLIRHEDWTPYFLAEYGTQEFFVNYNKLNPKYPLTAEKFQQIADMIMHKSTEKNVLSDIVSSQLDADRLDYLLRDNHFCGVRYGEFDFRWMLHCLAIVPSKTGNRLGITHKGVGVVEHYLMARRLMTRNIYHSQKKLALEFFLIQLLINLAESLEFNAAYANIRHSRLGQFLIAVNQFNQGAEKNDNLVVNKEVFLRENFLNYKELLDYDFFALIKHLADLCDPYPATQLATRIQHRKMPKIIRLDKIDLMTLQAELRDFKAKHHQNLQDWQLTIIQTPHQLYSDDDPILVIDEQKSISPIEQFSFMLNAVADKLEQGAFLCVDQLVLDEKPVKSFVEHVQKQRIIA